MREYIVSLIDRFHFASSRQNWTPLMCACASEHRSTCALLLSHQANLCAVNDRGMNVIHLAAFLGSSSLLDEFLHSIHANDSIILQAVNQVDYQNQSPLFYACAEGHLDVSWMLIQAGANLYHLDQDNQTCLHAMLASSVIFKRHIRLFFSLVQLVDFRSIYDQLNRTLLDLAYVNQLNSIIHLLTLLNYPRNYSIISNHSSVQSSQVFSLREISILNFKRSIQYHRTGRPLTQRELLEHALQQTFHIDLHRSMDMNENSYRKSLDDISTLSKKFNTKKSRKIEPTMQSSWSIFTNKFKTIRTPSNAIDASLEKPIHPMKNLVLMIFLSRKKLDDLLDFPSLNDNHFLDDDLKTILNAYHLQRTDASNQI